MRRTKALGTGTAQSAAGDDSDSLSEDEDGDGEDDGDRPTRYVVDRGDFKGAAFLAVATPDPVASCFLIGPLKCC